MSDGHACNKTRYYNRDNRMQDNKTQNINRQEPRCR